MPDVAAGAVVAIVDDDPAIRTALGRLTRALGYVPALFDGAEPLLADPSGLRIAAIVTDLQMPGLSGLDLLRILRRRRPALPVLVMTAYPSEAGRARALALGAFAYLAKPFDAEQFEHCLTVALGSAGNP
ncbi:response regulator [Methylobacterium sp. WL69]|uniref:response regulator n=1 Tax=Methylobacterium sp. WL69 TaxID=2603893 RepID=UPI0011C6F762|nr:response regulator [Methylobacterium sp. WL69]TXM73882.1 response regulator [Methylobacterium sp. WL69]